MNFDDLVGFDSRPSNAQPTTRTPLKTGSSLTTLTTRPTLLTDDTANNGFVSRLLSGGRRSDLQATRRTFIRSGVAATAATAAATFGGLFGPARRVEAQTGVVGEYPRRMLTYCPPYNSNDNCQPGCGSSPICTDCCGSDGFFRNEPANGYSLYPGGCGDGDIADGWVWRFNDTCGSCASIEYRCSDGYVQTDTGPVPFICRTVTNCEPLADGQEPGERLRDAAVDTNWRPAGGLEAAIDNGGSVTIQGWIADGSGAPVDMRITANGQIVHIGKAGLARPDIASRVRGAGANTGYGVSFPLEPGNYRICVDAVGQALSVSMGCIEMAVGSGQTVRGPSANTSVPGAPAASPDSGQPSTETTPVPEPTPAPEPTATPVPAAEAVGVASLTPTLGAVQVLRRSSPDTGFVSGWAGDSDSGLPARVAVVVDGEDQAEIVTELPQPQVQAAFADMGANTGFAGSFPLPPTQVEVCVELVDPQDGQRTPLGCRVLGAAPADDAETDGTGTDGTGTDDTGTDDTGPTATGTPSTPEDIVWGQVASAIATSEGATIAGWAIDPNSPRTPMTVTASATGDTTSIATGLANEPYDSAHTVYGIDSPCGFTLDLALPSGRHMITITATRDGGETHPVGTTTVTVP